MRTGAISEQARQDRRRRERERLSQPDLVRQKKPDGAVLLALLHEEGDERLLPRHQRLAARIDRRLRHRGRGQRAGRHVLDAPELGAAGATIDLADDRVGKRNALCPQVLELAAHPRDGLGIVVFPDDLVVLAPALARFVVAADERESRAIAALDDAGLAVQEGRVGAPYDPHRQVAAHQQLVELLVAVAAEQALRLRRPLEPLLAQRHSLLRRRPCGGQVARVEIAVADDAELLDGGEVLVDQIEQRAAKVAGDAVVAPGADEPLAQEDVIELALPR